MTDQEMLQIYTGLVPFLAGVCGPGCEIVVHDVTAAYIGNYEGKSKGRNFLSSTYFIKNEGRLIGLLCINKDMESLQNVNAALHSLLSAFNLYEAPKSKYRENLDTQMVNLLQNRVAQVIAESGVATNRLSLQEKVRIVHKLNDEGLLNVKGAVTEIAEQLSVSIPTVYRYLNKEVK